MINDPIPTARDLSYALTRWASAAADLDVSPDDWVKLGEAAGILSRLAYAEIAAEQSRERQEPS